MRKPLRTPTPEDLESLRDLGDVFGDEVEEADWDWLAQGYIPFGALTLVYGDPGATKTWMSLNVAAHLTRQGERVMILSNEDSPEKTLRKRLRLLKADLSKVMFVTKHLNIPKDMDALEFRIRQFRPRLVVLDTVEAYLGCSNAANQKVRKALTPLRHLAEEYDMAVVLITHAVKAKRSHLGGVSLGGLCRSVLRVEKTVVEDEDGDQEVFFEVHCVKVNMQEGPPAPWVWMFDNKKLVVVNAPEFCGPPAEEAEAETRPDRPTLTPTPQPPKDDGARRVVPVTVSVRTPEQEKQEEEERRKRCHRGNNVPLTGVHGGSPGGTTRRVSRGEEGVAADAGAAEAGGGRLQGPAP